MRSGREYNVETCQTYEPAKATVVLQFGPNDGGCFELCLFFLFFRFRHFIVMASFGLSIKDVRGQLFSVDTYKRLIAINKSGLCARMYSNVSPFLVALEPERCT